METATQHTWLNPMIIWNGPRATIIRERASWAEAMFSLEGEGYQQRYGPA